MKTRFAFAGFRHLHILGLWNGLPSHPRAAAVAACESDLPTRESLVKSGVRFTHHDLASMLADMPADAVAIGDIYSRRGSMILHALERGCHVLSDKPVCTDLAELTRIETTVRAKKLVLGAQFDLPEFPAVRRLRQIVRDGEIGEVRTISIAGQHPLRRNSRAAWYFEKGCHGGTINDIGIHFFDLLPWLTGYPFERLLSARTWNAKASGDPHFLDGAQVHATLRGGVGCLGDFSYLAPDRLGYELPNYWRMTIHGTKGMAETNLNAGTVLVARDADAKPREYAGLTGAPRQYLEDFLDEIEGRPSKDGLTTERILRSSRLALLAQQAADDNQCGGILLEA